MNDIEIICVICLEKIEFNENEYYELFCNHVYHLSCIMKWFNEKDDEYVICPLCRKNIIIS